MMKFKSLEGNLEIKKLNSGIEIKCDIQKNDYWYEFIFDEKVFLELASYLEKTAKEVWSDFEPKEAASMSDDFSSYYSRKYDSEAYLRLRYCSLSFEKASKETDVLYKFNKRRMQSFIYALKDCIKSRNYGKVYL